MKHTEEYFRKTKERKHHPLLKLAIEFIKKHKLLKPRVDEKLMAADLGCGTGGDTLYLLEQGYQVTAIDIEVSALGIVQERAKENSNLDSLQLFNCPIEEFQSPKQIDLITSNLALPYVGASKFYKAWSNIVQLINFQGVFSGQFFGERHAWGSDSSIFFLNMDQMTRLFRNDFEVVSFVEKQSLEQTTLNGELLWHQYDVCAVKRPTPIERPLLTFYDLSKRQQSKILAKDEVPVKEVQARELNKVVVVSNMDRWSKENCLDENVDSDNKSSHTEETRFRAQK
jgi:tellurite methyltransferase